MIVGWLGTLAALFSTAAFLPQLFKIRKQGGQDLSYLMLGIYLSGILLWLGYGLLQHAQAVIWANLVTALLVGLSIWMKVTYRDTGTGADNASPQRRPRVAVDMDEVIADSLSHHLLLYKRATGEEITAAQIAEHGVDLAVPMCHREIFDGLPHREGFFDDLRVIPDSQQAIRSLSLQFDVFITTAAMEVPASFAAKFKWLQRHFPFIPSSRIVFCGDKGIVDADYLIDDQGRHFRHFAGTGILFTAPHNVRQPVPLRADNWQEVLAILKARHPRSEL